MNDKEQYLPRWVILLAAVMCFVAIANMPYGYYLLVRWITCGVAIASAIQLHLNRHIGWVWALSIVALIFNPIFSLHFAKDIWRFLDFGAGSLFLIALWITHQDKQKS